MKVNRLLLYAAEVVFIVCFSGYLLIHVLACTTAQSGVLVGTAVGAATGKTYQDVQAWRAIGGVVGSYQQMEREREVLQAQQEAQRRDLEHQRAAEEERIRLAREQLEQQRRLEEERLRKEREEIDKQLELERKKLELQMQLERDKLAEQKRQFDASRQSGTRQENTVAVQERLTMARTTKEYNFRANFYWKKVRVDCLNLRVHDGLGMVIKKDLEGDWAAFGIPEGSTIFSVEYAFADTPEFFKEIWREHYDKVKTSRGMKLLVLIDGICYEKYLKNSGP